MRAPGSKDDPVFTQLKSWRDLAVRQSRIPLGAFKDSYLRTIARSGRRSAAEIERMLPTSLRPLAGEVADQLARIDPRSTPLGRADAHQSEQHPVAGQRPGAVGQNAGSAGQAPEPEYPRPEPERPRPEPEYPSPEPEGQPTGADDAGPSFGSRTPPSSTVPPSSAIPAEVGSRPGRQRSPGLDENRFAPYDFAGSGSVVNRLSIASTDQGLAIRWAPAEGAAVSAYRLIAADGEYPPYSPDQADLIAVTTETSASDPRPFGAAVRHLQVWSNSGDSIDELYLRQPRLLAEGAVVAPVQEVDIAEDQGQVIARWTTLPGITRVHVFRVPAERAARGIDQQFKILSDQPCLGGFVDRRADRGRRYVYFVQTEAAVGDKALLSAPLRRELTVSAVLEPVEDLTVVQGGDDAEPVFDLAWRRPMAGRVVIYRTADGPAAGADGSVVPLAALPQMKLTDDALLTHPLARLDDGRDALTGVPWPRDWDRAYLTPVTILDDRGRVGHSVPAVRVHQVTDPVLVERCDEQIVKFGWPSQAAAVVLQVTAPGQPPVSGQWPMEISRQRYDLLGGFVFAKPLPSAGCTIHLAGRSYTAGRSAETGQQVGIPVVGKSISIGYPGLLRLSYQVRPKRGLLRREVGIRIAAPQELQGNRVPPFVLVYRPDRLPLFADDGESLEVTEDLDEVAPFSHRFQPRHITQQPADCAWKASVKGRSGGYVRLFVDVPPDVLTRVALLDPAVDDLRVR